MLTAMMLRAQRAIVRRFEEAGATSTESARGAEELKLTPGIAWYQLVERGVLRCPGEFAHECEIYRLRRNGLDRLKRNSNTLLHKLGWQLD